MMGVDRQDTAMDGPSWCHPHLRHSREIEGMHVCEECESSLPSSLLASLPCFLLQTLALPFARNYLEFILQLLTTRYCLS